MSVTPATKEEVGQRIADRREALGLNQTQLAERVRVNQATVSDWETGKHKPRDGKWQVLAAALETDIASLFFSTGESVAS